MVVPSELDACGLGAERLGGCGVGKEPRRARPFAMGLRNRETGRLERIPGWSMVGAKHERGSENVEM